MSIRIVPIAIAALVGATVAVPALAEEEADAPPAWTGKVSAGGSVTEGNVNSVRATVEASAERDFAPHLVRLGLFVGYGKSDGTKDNDRQNVTEYYRYSFTDRFYAYGDSLQGRDSVQNIDFRFLLNAGPGYRIWLKSDTEYLDLEAGVGYRNELRSGDSNRNDATGRVGAIYADVFGPAVFQQTGEFLFPFNDTSAWLAKARTSLTFPLTDSWAFDNSLILEYNNDPVADPAGGTLKKFELDYIVSLVYSF